MDCPPSACRTAYARALAAAALILAAGGCASSGGLRGTVERALAAVGLKGARAVAAAPRTGARAVHRARNLNAGRGRKGVAVVVRVYQLRDAERFEQLPMARFLDVQGEQALGDDLVDVSEHVLLPDDTQQWPVRLADDARHIGVVALFRHPGDGPWRLVFDGRKARQQGVVVGVHACALTTASPALSTVMSGDPMSLSGVRCGD